MGGITLGILLLRRLPSLDVLILMHGGLPLMSPYRLPVVHLGHDHVHCFRIHQYDDPFTPALAFSCYGRADLRLTILMQDMSHWLW